MTIHIVYQVEQRLGLITPFFSLYYYFSVANVSAKNINIPVQSENIANTNI